MSIEKIFRTESAEWADNGHVYVRDSETGFWGREDKDDSFTIIYIGSVHWPGRVWTQKLIPIRDNLPNGVTWKGFVPDFVVGNRPVGLICGWNDIEVLYREHIKVQEGSSYDGIHVGSPIVEIYKELSVPQIVPNIILNNKQELE